MKHLNHIHYELVPIDEQKLDKEWDAIYLQGIMSDVILSKTSLFIYKFPRSKYISLHEFIRLANYGVINLHKEQIYILCEKLLDKLIFFNLQQSGFSHGNLKLPKSIWLKMNNCTLSFENQPLDYDIIFINFKTAPCKFEDDTQNIIGLMYYLLEIEVINKLVSLKNIQEQLKFIQSHIINIDQMTQQIKTSYLDIFTKTSLGPYQPQKKNLDSRIVEDLLSLIASWPLQELKYALFPIDLIDVNNLAKDYVFHMMIDHFYQLTKSQNNADSMEVCKFQFLIAEEIIKNFDNLNTVFHRQWNEVMENQECIQILLRKQVTVQQSEHEQINLFFEYLMRRLDKEEYFQKLEKFISHFDPEQIVKDFFKSPALIEQLKIDIRQTIMQEFETFLENFDKSLQNEQKVSNSPPQEP